MPLDEEVAERLRHVDKPVLLRRQQVRHAGARAAGRRVLQARPRQAVICVSAQQNRGKDELLERILEHAAGAEGDGRRSQDVALKLAIVGRRNTGKSTFINCLAQSERIIVSEVAGTTRDSVDVRFERDGKTFIAIDTAGVRRKKQHARRHRVLQPGPGRALDPPGRRGAAVPRRRAARSARWTSNSPTTSWSSTSRPSSSSTSGT